MRCRVRVAKPHSAKQRQLIEAFVTPGLNELWVACGSKWGKTLGLASAFAVAVPLESQRMYRWIAPIYAQALIGMRYCKRIFPKPPIVKITNSGPVPTLAIPSLDTDLQFWHGQHPEDLEGEAVHGQGVDEAAKQKEQVYASAKSTTTQTRGPSAFISTPRGKGWFYRGCMRAKLEMEKAAHEGRQPRAIFITAPTYDNPMITAEAIEHIRAGMSRRIFRQYIEAEFLDDGSVFEYLTDAFGNPVDFVSDERWVASTHESKAIFVGADWAKNVDYTTFIALNDQGRLVGWMRIQRRKYPEQVAALYAFLAQVKAASTLIGCQVVCEHDQTGVGEAVDDIIDATNTEGWDITGIVWTNKLKGIYVNDLILSFEEKAFQLTPPWKTLRDELAAYEANVSVSGNVIYGAPENQNDDTVSALMIANRLFRQGRGSISNIIVVDHLESVIRRLQYSGDLD